jgi:uncharacterized protein involved in oxidation of intracellular sulfur
MWKRDKGLPGGKHALGTTISPKNNYSNDPETVWNAFRFGNFALQEEDEVKTFLLEKGVEWEPLDTNGFKVTEQMRSFVGNGDKTFACGTCLEISQSEGSKMCALSTVKDEEFPDFWALPNARSPTFL